MASKTISRILNRSAKNIYSSSFSENDSGDDSFTSFYFDESEPNANSDNKHDLTENDYSEQKKEESFSGRGRIVFEHFEKEKKFLGTISSIDHSEHTFSAILISSDDLITRDVVFSIDDLPKELKNFVEIGRRIIYIYGKQYRNGTVTNVSNIYFRNNSRWTQREIELKENEAKELYDLLNDDDDK